MRRFWVMGGGGLLALAALASMLQARQGVVITEDGKRFEGDVVEHYDSHTIDITPKDGPTITVNRGNVGSVSYADESEAEVRRRLAQLDHNDIRGHLDLAQYAISKGNYEAAQQVLLDAQKVESNNSAVNDLLDRVNRQLRAHGPTTTEVTAPATRPVVATTQESTTRPVVAEEGGAKRMVTPEEINRIRALELGKNDTSVRVRIDPEARRKFLAFTGISNGDFNRLPPVQQAYMILDKGKRDMRDGVHILSDPPPLLGFRRDVLRTVVNGCATSKCHGTRGVGSFYLFPQADNEAAAYSDYIILQRTSHSNGSRRYSMIDRETPAESLLLQYLLPPEFADQPHPARGGYRGAVHNRQDQRFKQVANWISNDLPIPGPDYSFIDLSSATTKPTAAAAP